jgi:tripartite-type tricarboxylate transporter receptor subunit TctC
MRMLYLTVALLLAAGSFVQDARAQTYPNKPIRIVVPFVAGAAAIFDNDGLSEIFPELGPNQAGKRVHGAAGGNIGADVVAKSPPDGYTMLLATTGQAISASLYRTLPFDPVKDFAPVTQVISSTFVLLASNKVPVSSTQELIALAKAKPGGLNYGSSGVGGPLHLAMEVFKSAAGVDVVHIPYRGDALLYAALIAGDIQMAMSPQSTSMPHIQSGSIRALGVTGTHRAAQLPNVPTFKESGVTGLESSSWQGLFMPARTPREIVLKIQQEVAKVLRNPEVRERLAAMGGAEPVGGTPEEFDALFKADIARFARVIEQASIPKAD